MEILEKLYTNPTYSSAFAGINTLYHEAKKHDPHISKQNVIDFLEGQTTYTLHKPRRLNFLRSKTIPSGYLTDVQADLADFQKLSRYNQGHKYMLVVIDVLSRQVWTAPVKTKKYIDMKKAFDKIFEQMPMIPHNLYTDKGGEFESHEMKEYFKEKEIGKFASKASIMKASVAERCIRNIKQRLYKYFTQSYDLNWVDVTPKIISGINKSICRITGMKPKDIGFHNAQKVREKVYGKNRTYGKKPRYKVGDKMRMTRAKGIFTKGYMPTHSDEIVEIEKVIRQNPILYKVKDYKDEPFLDRFYEQELGKTRKDGSTLFRIDKKIKSRVADGEKEWLCKLTGYPGTYWIKDAEFKN